MKQVKKHYNIIFSMLMISILFGCTNLDEEIKSNLPGELARETFDASQLLGTAYNNLQLFGSQDLAWSLQEHSSDELIPPLRGADWDNNGRWKVLHTHEWDADSQNSGNTFNALLNAIFNCNEVLTFDPSLQEEAEALFLRAFFMFSVNDLYGQVPFREPGEDVLLSPVILNRKEAVAQMLSDLNTALPNLADTGAPERATKNAARMLMARVYLNKFVYEGLASPSEADMNQVISLSQEIINSGTNSLLSGIDFYKSFEPANDISELILVANYTGGEAQTIGDSMRNKYFSTLHYNQTPGGWNGFATIADFYNTFTDDNDVRKSASTTYTEFSGVKMGFLIGQQFDGTGIALKDRLGNPLNFTKEVELLTLGDALEVNGIRVMKYTPDFENEENPNIDAALMRLGEVYLNLAEAYLWNGDTANAMATLNILRAERNAAPLTSIDATSMLNERGFELYWEGFRRTDQIRFGDFNNVWQDKSVTDPTRNLFPIPNSALGANPNLKQNPGY